MAIPVEMPKMSDTMEEGVLVSWLVEEGASVSAGDVIAQVETDKATMDLEVYDDGVLLKKVIQEGEAVPIGGLIAVLGEEGEDISEVLAKYGGGDGSAAPEPETKAEAVEAEAGQAPSGDGAAEEAAVAAGPEEGARIKASPLARKMAREHGIDLRTVRGSGPEGRIIKRDIEALLAGAPVEVPEAAPKPAPAEAPAEAPAMPAAYDVERISQMRKTIARRLAQSKFTAPHFYLTVDVDMEKATAFREQLNELAEAQGRGKVSFNDLVTKACALALRQHPYVNASYLEAEGEIRLHREIHVAVAVAIDEGLITPVIRHADRKGLGQIAEETRRLAEKARNRELQPEEYTGSTFTTSNLGMFGIDEFTAIINPPNACILAIGAIRDVPVVRDGEVVPGRRMRLTLSCDHRIVDGAVGARFLTTVRQYLEEPLNLLL
ncbi:pyruvate dehydrogenase complex dihydrolipoamide acetyltransferase [Rhodocaloribacter litoris]|uniref:pyruvate dehydrogenase complex dihydrolipoamide acetyltransferase n=1 Tax=Rhodocaloribacter litoris TaxID=2558931 RepID=UPI0014225897|nr:pyruvate dehydrogenase complex dihydrolipoamide acetyltransferase [Rhodocaloribacter litoris]QXD16378.1 pyruvate dehydrogenase complex dihydrolipoamide acetyltransferase [Rhodocaloribacter litoris]